MGQQDELLDSDFDGIREYDNDLPRWWVWLFVLTVVFSVVYVGYLHLGPGLDQHEQLELELAALEKIRAKSVAERPVGEDAEQMLAALLGDSAVLLKGKEVFTGKCVACHAAQGQGLVGPNLTDDYWIHGGTLVDIRKVVADGVPAKGMIPWKGVIPADDIDAVTVYVRTLRGTNPPNPKAPQGELVEFN